MDCGVCGIFAHPASVCILGSPPPSVPRCGPPPSITWPSILPMPSVPSHGSPPSTAIGSRKGIKGEDPGLRSRSRQPWRRAKEEPSPAGSRWWLVLYPTEAVGGSLCPLPRGRSAGVGGGRSPLFARRGNRIRRSFFSNSVDARNLRRRGQPITACTLTCTVSRDEI